MVVESESHELPELNRQLLDFSSEQRLSNHGILRNTLTGLSPRKILSNILHGLKPELFRSRKATPRPGSTAWLDGLRGCAALVVCVSHLTGYVYYQVGLCYGHETSPGIYYTSPINLPFIRLIFSGQYFSVVLFFFISGYVLTKRLISLLHQGRRDEFLDSLNSAICRRPGRLFFPVIWSTLALAFIWHLTGIATPFPPRQPTLITELVNWFRDILLFLFPFRQNYLWTTYNYHSWTIPMEFRGSMMVYVWLFGSSQFTTRARVLMTLMIVQYGVVWVDAVFYTSFFAGLLTAELDLIYAEEDGTIAKLPWDGVIYALRQRPKLRKVLLHLLLLAGLFLAGEPYTQWHPRDPTMETCGIWGTLNKVIPAAYDIEPGPQTAAWRWFWIFWAAWFTLIACKEIDWARKLFETRPAQCKRYIHCPLLQSLT